jgi:Putative beta-barrel porin-2, OmpL-like. bbp2
MTQLQGTYPGYLLDGNGVRVSGWGDSSYTASTVAHDQLPMGFNYKANQFLVQQSWLRVEKPIDDKSDDPMFGFRTDAYVGTDYRFLVARGLFSGQLTANYGGPNTYGFDPIEFYAEGYFPQIGRGLDVKVGRFFALFGVETNDAPSSPLPSRSYFVYDPFTYTGSFTTLKLDDAWTVQNGLTLGSDAFINEVDNPTYVGTVKYAPPSGRDSVQVSVVAGWGCYDQARQFSNPQLIDVVFTHKFDQLFSYTLDALAARQDHVSERAENARSLPPGTVDWFGVVQSLSATLGPRLSAVGRLEFFDDCQGQRTSFRGLYAAQSACLAFKPKPWLLLRPEVRDDYNGESRPFQNQHGLATATMDAIVRC